MSRSTRQRPLCRTTEERWDRLAAMPDAIARLQAEGNFDPTVRIHSALARFPEARLWYLLRSLDREGRGAVRLDLAIACDLLNRSLSSIYRLLKVGRERGYFRRWARRGETLVVWLGSRNNIARSLELETWGTTAEISLKEVLESLKATATQAVTQKLQKGSREQAKRTRPQSQKRVRVATPQELLSIPAGAFPYLANGRRATPAGTVGADQKRIYVSQSFAHYGVSQARVGEYCSISDRTVRRHLTGVESKQLMQHYPELETARGVLTNCKATAVAFTLNGASTEFKTEALEIRLGRLRRYRDKTYLRRCAIYNLDLELKRERTSRLYYRDSEPSRNPGQK